MMLLVCLPSPPTVFAPVNPFPESFSTLMSEEYVGSVRPPPILGLMVTSCSLSEGYAMNINASFILLPIPTPTQVFPAGEDRWK